MMEISRRSFLKLLGVAGASAAMPVLGFDVADIGIEAVPKNPQLEGNAIYYTDISIINTPVEDIKSPWIVDPFTLKLEEIVQRDALLRLKEGDTFLMISMFLPNARRGVGWIKFDRSTPAALRITTRAPEQITRMEALEMYGGSIPPGTQVAALIPCVCKPLSKFFIVDKIRRAKREW